MRQIALTILVGLSISLSLTAQSYSQKNNLSQKEKMLLMEERIKNYEKELSTIKEEVAKEEKRLEEKLEIKNAILENKARQVNWLLLVSGTLVSLFGICLPIALIIISKKIHNTIIRDRKYAQKSLYRLEDEVYRKVELQFRKYDLMLNKHQEVKIPKETKKKKVFIPVKSTSIFIEKEKTITPVNDIEIQVAEEKIVPPVNDIEIFVERLITNFLNSPYPDNDSQNKVIIKNLCSSINTTFVEKEFAMINELYNQKNYSFVINRCGDLLKNYESSLTTIQLAFIYFQLAYSFRQTEKPENAIKYFSKVTALLPNNLHAHEMRGKGYAERGDYENALSDFNRALRLDPNSIQSIHNRIEILLCLNNLQEIEAQFKRTAMFTLSEGNKFSELYLETIYAILNDKNTFGIDALFIRLKSSVNYKPKLIERSLQVIKKGLDSIYHTKTPRDKKEFIIILIDKLETWRGGI